MPKSVPRLRPAMSRQSVSGVCAYVHMHIYAYAYALARALALPVRVCVPHLSCLLCSALSSHVPCSYDMSAHARAHAALGADMHMCMGACPAGCWCGRLLPAIRSLYQIRKGFGSCRVPVRLLPHSCGVHVPHRVPALADVCRQVRPAGHTARSRAVRLLQTAASASPVPGLPRARPHRCCWALRGLVRRLDAPHLWGSIPRTCDRCRDGRLARCCRLLSARRIGDCHCPAVLAHAVCDLRRLYDGWLGWDWSGYCPATARTLGWCLLGWQLAGGPFRPAAPRLVGSRLRVVHAHVCFNLRWLGGSRVGWDGFGSCIATSRTHGEEVGLHPPGTLALGRVRHLRRARRHRA